jgi:hypothetical protein
MQSSFIVNIDTIKEHAVFRKFMLMVDFCAFMNLNTM